MDIEKITECTYCGKVMPDFKVAVTLNTEVYRNTLIETVEEIENMKLQSSEVLCMDCYNTFIGVMREFMEKRNV